MNIIPASKLIFETILDVLNDNQREVIFSGNYMFRFWQQNSKINEFEIVQREEDELDFKTQRVVPLVDLQTIEIPFVEKNIRSDYEKEFYLAFKIQDEVNEFNQRVIEFDFEDDHYQSLLEGIQKLRDNPIIDNVNNYRYVFKVKEPQKVNVFKYNGEYYQLLSLNLNLISIKFGHFTNETKILMREKGVGASFEELDLVDGDIGSSKNMIPFIKPLQNLETKSRFNSRAYLSNYTINFIGSDIDMCLIDEADGIKPLKTIYEYKVVRFDESEYTFDVAVTSSNYNLRKNTIHQINFQIEKV